MFVLGQAILALTLWQARTPPVTGLWSGIVVIDGVKDKGLVRWELRLHKAGKFSWHMEQHTMVDVVEDCTGTYRVTQKGMELRGQRTAVIDDGYGKNTVRKPITVTLKRRSGQMWMKVDKQVSVVFTRMAAAAMRS